MQSWTRLGNSVKKWPVIQTALRKPINDFKGLKVTHTSILTIYDSMYVCICVYVCMYIYIYIYIYLYCIYIYIQCIYILMYIRMYLCIYIFMYIDI